MDLQTNCLKDFATPTEMENFNVDDLIEYSPDEVSDGNAFECSNCELSCASLYELRRHKAVMHGGWPLATRAYPSIDEVDTSTQLVYVCSLCLRQYELREDLRGHIIEFHKYTIEEQTEAAEIIESTNVEDVLKTKPAAVRNNMTKEISGIAATVPSPVKPSTAASNLEMRPLPFKDFRLFLRLKMLLRCPVNQSCVYKFETAAKAEMHAKCHGESLKREFKCHECGLEFPNWRRCSSHLWKSHQLDVDLLQCPSCDFKDHASVLVWRHMRFHKKWRSRVLKSMHAVREKRQREPVKLSTDEPPKAVPNKNKYYAEKTCEICNRKFVNGKTLSKHVKSVHNKIKPFICNVCGKKMARKASLIIHMRQHTGEKPLECKTCKFATRDPSVLKKHQMRHENTAKLKCQMCEYVCIQANAYKRHIRLKHPEEYKKIACDLCSFVTINEQRLLAHKEDHRKGLIVQIEDSLDASGSASTFKNPCKQHGKLSSNADISTDYFLPLESIDSLPHEPAVDTGGVTIPAPSEDTQFPTYLNN